MIWLALAEGVLLCVLALVVVALAHSYAGLAARLGGLSGEPARDAPRRGSARGGENSQGVAATLAALDGVTPLGERVLLPIAPAASDTLLAFLTTSCASCRRLWDDLPAHLHLVPRDVRLVVVTKGPEHESISGVAARAASLDDVDVVMDSAAWTELGVPGSPYFVLLSRATGDAVGEGTAISWPQALELMSISTADRRLAKSGADQQRERDVDRVLREAGVFPGDPSLYPERDPGALRR